MNTPPRRPPGDLPPAPRRLTFAEETEQRRQREEAQRATTARIHQLEEMISFIDKLLGKHGPSLGAYNAYRVALRDAKRELNMYQGRDRDIANAELLLNFANQGRPPPVAEEAPIPQFQPLVLEAEGEGRRRRRRK